MSGNRRSLARESGRRGGEDEGAAVGERTCGKRLLREGKPTRGRCAAGPRFRAPHPPPETRPGAGAPGGLRLRSLVSGLAHEVGP